MADITFFFALHQLCPHSRMYFKFTERNHASSSGVREEVLNLRGVSTDCASLCRGTDSAIRALLFEVRFKMTVYGPDSNWRHDFWKTSTSTGATTRPNTDTIQLKLTRGPFHYNSEVGFSEFLAGYAVSSAP